VIHRIRHNGHSLAGTLVGLVLVMLLWTALYRQTTGFLRMEKACRLRSDRAAGCTRALAWGLTLLETGRPSVDLVSYRVTVADGPGGTYVLIFEKTPEKKNHYTVSVRPATEDDSSLPLAPDNFN